MSEVIPFPTKVREHDMTAQSEIRFDPDAGPLEIMRAHQTAAPVPVEKLANALGLVVVDEPDLTDDISGLIERANESEARSGYRIIVNERHTKTRKRFTIAHEIAHYLLHRDQIGDRLQDDALYRSRVSSKIEREANQLAADILMPRDLIESELRNRDAISIDDLARHFEVSKIAMAIRLDVPTD